MTRLLGIDLGTRRIGLAVADTASGRITGLATIRRGDAARDQRTLAAVVGEQRIDELVLGLPFNLDGSEGAQAFETRRWSEQVLEHLSLPVSLRDERLTSERAERRLGTPARGSSGGPPSPAARAARRRTVDREAAVLILQSELDARAGSVAER